MNRITFTLLITLAYCTPWNAYAQQKKKFVWATPLSYSNASTNLYNAMKTDRYGNTYAGGISSGLSQGASVFCAIKINGNGLRMWQKAVAFTPASLPLDGQPKTVVHTYGDSSSVYIVSLKGTLTFDTLSSRMPIGSDILAFRLDKNGNVMWWCQLGSGTEDELVATFDTHDSDIVIHARTVFKNNQHFFLRPVNGLLVKDSTLSSSFDFFDYFFTLRKDGTAGPVKRIYTTDIAYATLLKAFPLPGNKIELLVRTPSDMNFTSSVSKWSMNQDGTSLTKDALSFPIRYSSSSGLLSFTTVEKTSAGKYMASVTTNSASTYLGNDTILSNKSCLISISNDLSAHVLKRTTIAATPMHSRNGNVLWTALSLTNMVLGTDTFKNRNNQFVQHFVITDENLQLRDTFQLLNQSGQSAALKNIWLNDSAEVTCMFNGINDTYLDTITVKAGNKSWYHYATLAKRGFMVKPNSNPNTRVFYPIADLQRAIIYPNPCKAGEQLIIEHAADYDVQSITLYSTDGKCMDAGYQSQMSSIQVPQVPAGFYVLHVQFINGERSTHRLVVE